MDTLYAQAAQTAKPGIVETFLIPMGFMLIIMYILMIRPQQKKLRDHQELLNALKPGDEVVTTGGIIGTVKSVAEGFVSLDTGGGHVIKVVKSHVSQATKPAPKPAKKAAAT
jgi:preprotein translocase subunit YajC